MNGYFVSPYIELEDYPGNEVPPGEQVRIRAHYYAYAPEQNWWDQEWSVSVVVYKSGDPSYKIYGQNDTTHLTMGPLTHDVLVSLGSMPSEAITYLVVLWGNLSAWKAFPENGSNWVQLDARYITVNPLTDIYQGAISRKELEYDSEQESIPASDIQFDLTGRVHVWGRNDAYNNQKMGIEWWVRDPDNNVVQHYLDWELTFTQPGNAQHFIGSRFDLNEVGNWTIKVNLLMNQTSPEIVDTYNGRLCNVLPEEAAYDGTITKKEIHYNSTKLTIPASSLPFGVSAEVNVNGRNDSNQNQKMGIRWWVKDPDGQTAQTYTRWETTWTQPGNAQSFVGPNFDLDKDGEWRIKIELLENYDNPVVVDSYDGRLCTVRPEEELYEGTITTKQIIYDGQTAQIPAVGIGLHDNGKVRILGRNDTEVNQKMGIEWTVSDPNGTVVQNYDRWETTWTQPGNAQTFQGPSIEFTEAGWYTIYVRLKENPDNPVYVDQYQGNLCEVGVGAEEEFGEMAITSHESEVQQGNPVNIEVNIRYRGPNTSRVLHAAIWQQTLLDPHDEVAFGEITVDIPGSAEWEDHTVQVVVYATCDAGTYGLYAKLGGIIPDAITPYYAGVLTVGGGGEAGLFEEFSATYSSA